MPLPESALDPGLLALVNEWAEANPALLLALYLVLNTLVTGVCPFPLGVVLMVVGALIYGMWWGLLFYVLSCTTGAYLTFRLARSPAACF